MIELVSHHPWLGRVTGSTYLRAVTVLSTGQFIAAALPMMAAPVLGRLYMPSEYGVLATYMALASIIGGMSTLQLEGAIITERSERRAVALVGVCRRIAAGVAFVAAIVALSIYLGADTHVAYREARGWLLLLPATVLVAGANAAVAALANRRKRYADIARIPLSAAALTVSASILLGWLGCGVHGLFTSYFLGQALALVLYLRMLRVMVERMPALGWRRAAALVTRHRGFVLYTLPSEVVGNVSLQLPVLVLSGLGATTMLGSFSRARQLIVVPLQLIGSSIGQVFRQRAAEEYHATGSCRRIWMKTFVALAALGFPPTLLLMVFAPDIIRIVLGPNWTEAGEVARKLAPMLYLGFVSAPLANVFYIRGRQREDLFLNIAGLGLLTGLVALGGRSAPGAVVIAYAIGYSLIYIVYLARSWIHANG